VRDSFQPALDLVEANWLPGQQRENHYRPLVRHLIEKRACGAIGKENLVNLASHVGIFLYIYAPEGA
jgi:hypothetical protein